MATTVAVGISAAAWQAPQVLHLWAVSPSGVAWSCKEEDAEDAEDAACTAFEVSGGDGAQNAWDTAANP